MRVPTHETGRWRIATAAQTIPELDRRTPALVQCPATAQSSSATLQAMKTIGKLMFFAFVIIVAAAIGGLLVDAQCSFWHGRYGCKSLTRVTIERLTSMAGSQR
jgi:hypothetical protein